jgi:hypothetical protein
LAPLDSTARSSGVSVSSTTIIANDTDSAVFLCLGQGLDERLGQPRPEIRLLPSLDRRAASERLVDRDADQVRAGVPGRRGGAPVRDEIEARVHRPNG